MEPKIVIKQGYWRAAGNVFGWTKDGYHVFGIGVDVNDLIRCQKYVNIHIDGNKYRLYREEAREFKKKYNSYKVMPGGTKLVVVSKDLLKTN